MIMMSRETSEQESSYLLHTICLSWNMKYTYTLLQPREIIIRICHCKQRLLHALTTAKVVTKTWITCCLTEKFLALVQQTSIIFQDAMSNAKCLNALRLLRINWLKSCVMKVYLPNRLELIAMQINIRRDKFLSPFSLCCFQDVMDTILHLQLCVGAVRVI